MHFDITPPNLSLTTAIQEKINLKTKPLGSLGLLEQLALSIGLIQQSLSPTLNRPTMLVFAGDHGIAQTGISAYPQIVTTQMVHNFLNGGAAINVFSRQHQIHLKIVDSGVNADFSNHPALIHAKIAYGTQNFLNSPAMTSAQCETAIKKGAEITENIIEQGCNIVALGEMGIGNTASASCIMAILCQLPLQHCVGRGTGLDNAGLDKKTKLLQQSLDVHALKNDVPLKVLATFGGFEIAMLVGAMLKAAEKKCVILIDGFITTAALLVAHALYPNILHYCVFSHCSNESGHQKMLDFLHVQPLLNLNLRLGEGSGAALAFPLVVSAVSFLNEMASFASANVSTSTTSPCSHAS